MITIPEAPARSIVQAQELESTEDFWALIPGDVLKFVNRQGREVNAVFLRRTELGLEFARPDPLSRQHYLTFSLPIRELSVSGGKIRYFENDSLVSHVPFDYDPNLRAKFVKEGLL